MRTKILGYIYIALGVVMIVLSALSIYMIIATPQVQNNSYTNCKFCVVGLGVTRSQPLLINIEFVLTAYFVLSALSNIVGGINLVKKQTVGWYLAVFMSLLNVVAITLLNKLFSYSPTTLYASIIIVPVILFSGYALIHDVDHFQVEKITTFWKVIVPFIIVILLAAEIIVAFMPQRY